jgi:hypothetical protein
MRPDALGLACKIASVKCGAASGKAEAGRAITGSSSWRRSESVGPFPSRQAFASCIRADQKLLCWTRALPW